jgi:hypothetical protein
VRPAPSGTVPMIRLPGRFLDVTVAGTIAGNYRDEAMTAAETGGHR